MHHPLPISSYPRRVRRARRLPATLQRSAQPAQPSSRIESPPDTRAGTPIPEVVPAPRRRAVSAACSCRGTRQHGAVVTLTRCPHSPIHSPIVSRRVSSWRWAPHIRPCPCRSRATRRRPLLLAVRCSGATTTRGRETGATATRRAAGWWRPEPARGSGAP
jgi:hypothetical protein